jgi:hypothetical protein
MSSLRRVAADPGRLRGVDRAHTAQATCASVAARAVNGAAGALIKNIGTNPVVDAGMVTSWE